MVSKNSALIALVIAVAPAIRTVQSAVEWDQLRKTYDNARYDSVDHEILSASRSFSPEKVENDFERATRSWPPTDVAKIALEGALSTEDLDSEVAFFWLEYARHRLREQAPSQWEHEWLRAAVTLLEGPIGHKVILGGREIDEAQMLALGLDPDLPSVRIGLSRLADNANDRFQGDQSFEFAMGLEREQRVYAWSRSIGVELQGPLPIARGFSGRVLPPRRTEAQAAFRLATTGPNHELRTLALVHLGSIESYNGDTKNALADWQTAGSEGVRPETRYLSALLSARTLWGLGRRQDALESLESALADVPNAQSAVVMAAALGHLAAQDDEPARLADELLSRRDAPDDPWWSYFQGEFDRLGSRVSAVRGKATGSF
jgi:hypothetical protein